MGLSSVNTPEQPKTWQVKTSDYTAKAGDKLRVDCSAGDVTITLPINPQSSDTGISIQRVDDINLGTRLLLKISNNQKINSKRPNIFDGLISLPIENGNVEVFSYRNNTDGWFGENGLLNFQLSQKPSPDRSLIDLQFEGADGSIVFNDSSSYGRVVTTFGNPIVSNADSIAGLTSGFLDGNSGFIVPHDPLFNFGSKDFLISFKLKSSFPSQTVSILTISDINPSPVYIAPVNIMLDVGAIKIRLNQQQLNGSYELRAATNILNNALTIVEFRKVKNELILIADDNVSNLILPDFYFEQNTLPITIGKNPNSAVGYNGYIDDLVIRYI